MLLQSSCIYMYNVVAMYMCTVGIIRERMLLQKEGRKKQARSTKQQSNATQHTQGSHFSMCMYNVVCVLKVPSDGSREIAHSPISL